MKDINFIKPIPEHKKQELRRWVLLCIVIALSMLIAASIITYTQLKIHSSLTKEKDKLQEHLIEYDAIMEKQSVQKKEQELLQTKLNTLTACRTCANNPLNIIKALRTILKESTLQSLSISKNNFELQAMCGSAQKATELVANLSQTSLFKNSSLISLQSSHNNRLLGTIKGQIT